MSIVRIGSMAFAIGFMFFSVPACAAGPNATPFSTLETKEGTNSFRLRKLIVPDQGFKYGDFTWNAANNSYALTGPLKADGNYYGRIELWKRYEDQAVPQSESISGWAGGIGVNSIEFKSPKGVTYSAECKSEDAEWGLQTFKCSKGGLPVGQTEFGNGKYVVTFSLASGQKVTRDYYVSGNYPTRFNITYPVHGSTNVPTSPTVKWVAVGAAGYDFIINDANQNEVYCTYLSNSIDAIVSHVIPSGTLQPNTRYYLTIEANAPKVNGGTKGFKKRVEFTTGD